MRLHPSAPRLGAGVALAITVALVSCSNSSNSTGNPDSGSASGDDAATIDSSINLGDDVAEEVPVEDSTLSGNCEVPNGKYTLTMTPTGDAGGWDDGGEGEGGNPCVVMTSTVTFPLKMGEDSGLECNLSPDGSLPSCTIDFNCTQTYASTTATTIGYIQVYNSSYTGYESVQLNENAVGMQGIYACNYNLSYVKQ
jgi:hypothetical protein